MFDENRCNKKVKCPRYMPGVSQGVGRGTALLLGSHIHVIVRINEDIYSSVNHNTLVMLYIMLVIYKQHVSAIGTIIRCDHKNKQRKLICWYLNNNQNQE